MAEEVARKNPALDRVLSWAAILLPLSLTVFFFGYAPQVAEGGAVSKAWNWFQVEAGEGSFSVDLSFKLDGLSLLFSLIIAGVGTLILLYASKYFEKHPHLYRITMYLLLFMLSMLGLVLSNNLLVLFVFWELTTIFSYFLIGTDHQKENARSSALQALVVTGSGGLLMLAGFVVLGQIGGSYEIDQLIAQRSEIVASSKYPLALLLVLAGAFTKSAQWPFHFWLPGAMAAPTPISAYLHSATMVKAGVYLLARLNPALGGTTLWMTILVTFGAITAVHSAIVALRFTDLKIVLAYTTVTALGIVTLLLGIGTPEAAATAAAFILTHSLYKGGLFMVVGILDKQCGSRDYRLVAGVGHSLPITAVAALLAGVSMSGLPPTIGFLSKELMYEATTHMGWFSIFVTLAAVVANAMMVLLTLVLLLRPFMGAKTESPKEPQEANFALWLGPLTLGTLSLFTGLFCLHVGTQFILPGASSIEAHHYEELHLWHGFNLPLLLSVITVGLGIFGYQKRELITRGIERALEVVPVRCEHGYQLFMTATLKFADWQTRAIQTGLLRHYLFVVFSTIAILVGFTLVAQGAIELVPDNFLAPNYHEVVVLALIVSATFFAIRLRSRLAMICSLGVVGLGVSAIFFMFGAPDVAMTQLMVETLVVFIVVLVFLRLPAFEGNDHPGRVGQVRDWSVAIACGSVVTLTLLAVINTPLDTYMSEYFLTKSYPEAHGKNVVNVILVDFRGVDTMGEITVLTMAGLAAFALIKLRTSRKEAS